MPKEIFIPNQGVITRGARSRTSIAAVLTKFCIYSPYHTLPGTKQEYRSKERFIIHFRNKRHPEYRFAHTSQIQTDLLNKKSYMTCHQTMILQNLSGPGFCVIIYFSAPKILPEAMDFLKIKLIYITPDTLSSALQIAHYTKMALFYFI